MSHLLRFLLFGAALALGAGALTSCQSALNFASPSVSWQTYTGQMHYSNAAGKSVVGDVVARRSLSGHDFQLQFSSGPGFSLMKVYESREMGRAEGIFARHTWQGRIGAAPAHVRNWLLLREAFTEAAVGKTSFQGAGWSGQVERAGEKPERMTLSFTDGGERFAFHFNR